MIDPKKYPWCGIAQRGAWRGGEPVKRSFLLPLVGQQAECERLLTIDKASFEHQELESLIDDFILTGEHKVVANDSTPDSIELSIDRKQSVAKGVVSEQLAEIYLRQGLFDEAIEIYRILSLADTKKSVYFAELIEKAKQAKN